MVHAKTTPTTMVQPALPKEGKAPEELWAIMDDAIRADVKWRDGRAPGLVYLAGDDVLQVAKEAYLKSFSGNALSSSAFPSLHRFETEVIGMTAQLLRGGQAVGNVTSGGSESIFLGVKGARDRARAERPEVIAPEIVAPVTAHPAFNKAAHYFGLKVVRTPVREDYRVAMEAYRSAVTDNTVLMVGSAPNYPYGMIDPIPEMAAIAEERNISFHVDACVGGYFLPFVEKLGYTIIPFDFRIPGVTSISADLHKFGYTAKGASAILCRDPEIHQHQGYEFGDWPSGTYRTLTMTGTRPGGAIAAAWAVMNYLGEEGYLRLVGQTMRYIRKLIDGINAIPELMVLGQPDMSVFAYGSASLDIYAVGDGLEERGWLVYRDRQPPALHVMLSPGHEPFMETYLHDLEQVTRQVAEGGLVSRKSEARYG